MDNEKTTPRPEGQNEGQKPSRNRNRNRRGRGHGRGNSPAEGAEVQVVEGNTPRESTPKEGPAKESPAKDGPAKDGSAKDAPAKEGSAKDGPKKQNRGRGGRGRSDKRDGKGGRADRAPQPEAPANTEKAKPQEGGERRSHPSTGRPQAAPRHTPARISADLPDMDDLLIEDGMNPAPAKAIPPTAADPDAVEELLARDPFAEGSQPIPEVLPEGKVVIVGIRFRAGGKTYFFDPGELVCKAGQSAIVETARGLEFGEVYIGNRLMDESMVVPPLRPVVRIATEADIAHNRENHEREEEAFRIGVRKIMDHKLDMKLVAVQYTFDNSKLLFYFTSAKRVDFRELVKDLAGVFHLRIELRQIGIRDEARMIGGLGPCGRPLCCTTFLSDFGQVSMKMAKEQNLSLNSTKISGCCGRLMCCLRYEHETYVRELADTPSVGTFVNTPDGPGVVTDVYLLQGEVKVSLRGDTENPPKKYKREELEYRAKERRHEAPAVMEMDDEPDSDE